MKVSNGLVVMAYIREEKAGEQVIERAIHGH